MKKSKISCPNCDFDYSDEIAKVKKGETILLSCPNCKKSTLDFSLYLNDISEIKIR